MPMPAHPLLFAIFPLLAYYAANSTELSPSVLYLPLVYVFAFGGIVWAVCNMVFRSATKGAIFASSVLLLFFSHRHLVEVVKMTRIFGAPPFGFGYHLVTAVIEMSLLSGIGLYLIYKKNPDTKYRITGFLNLLSILLVIFATVRITYAEVHTPANSVFEQVRNLLPKIHLPESITEKPDIYYLIFDRYANSYTLNNDYNYDNTSFLGYLEKQGFYIAQESNANYPKTYLSLASSLNMLHLSDLAQYIDKEQKDQDLLYRMIDDNVVAQILKDIGYTFVFFESRYPPLNHNRHADKTVPLVVGSNSFSYALLETTVLEPFVRNVLKKDLFNYHIFSDNDQRTNHLNQAKEVINIAKDPKPTFTFSHFLLPHDPYVFNAKCLPQNNIKLSSGKLYIEQLKCTNIIITKIVNGIFAESPKPPIIIIQSDEGPFDEREFLGRTGEGIDWHNLSTQAIQKHMRILNAYFFPGFDYVNLYPGVTPINTFRIIFDHYFNMKLPLLRDKSYIIPDTIHPYKYINVSGIVSFEKN